MNDSATVLHTAHRDKNRHLHFLMLLLPSLAFVFVLSLFLRNRFAPVLVSEQKAASQTLTPITVKDTIVNVRVARTPDEQTQGLSGVSSMDANEGMLFLFPSESQPPFWMKDMLIPLDFIWIHQGKITQINKNVLAPAVGTPENKLQLYIPNDPVNSVLEVNVGFSDLHQIVVGDSVTIP